ncbi:DUF4326 domain-containing protein [Sphingomonas melonis]|uniref:DUF4326 domain-containing protein n=1 Tax=Sphingomonas melonis TaxID=152682 RepID=UPI0035C84DA9
MGWLGDWGEGYAERLADESSAVDGQKPVRPRLWNRSDPERPRRCRSIMRGTPLGNPFIVGVHGTRAQVIEAYAFWLRQQPELMAKIRAMSDDDLVCCCSPMPCHGDVILAIWDELHH